MKKELSKEELETLLHCLQYVMDYNREQEYPVPQKFKTLELKLKNLLMIEKRSLKC